jgi:hypothetical protein
MRVQATPALCRVRQLVGLAALLHQVDSLERLQCPEQHTRTDARLFCRDIEHVGHAIDKVNASKTAAQEQGVVPCRLSVCDLALAEEQTLCDWSR